MDQKGVVRGTLIRQPSAEAITVAYRDDRYSLLYPEETRSIDLFDHPNVFVVEVDNPDLERPMRVISSTTDLTVHFRPSQWGDALPNMKNWTISLPQRNCRSTLTTRCSPASRLRKPVLGTPAHPLGHSVFDVVALYKGDISALYQETGWRLDLEAPYRMTHTGKRVLYL